MKIVKDSYYGLKVLQTNSSSNLGADVLIKGYLEGYYADTEPWVGVSTNARMNFNPRNWKQFKEEVDDMFAAVKKERGITFEKRNGKKNE